MSTMHRELSFAIHWAYDPDECNPLDFFDEGIELSLRRPGDFIWTPLDFFTLEDPDSIPNNLVPLQRTEGEELVMIRGYNVTATVDGRDIQHHMRLRFCHESLLGSEAGIQFRWLQTMQRLDDNKIRDVWSLDNIQVFAVYNDLCNITMFSDDFESGDGLE